jgi:ABC-2 type transport system permease protein
MIVLIPLMDLLMFGYAINVDPKNMPAAVLAQDHSVIARSFVTGLANTEYFSIDREVLSEKEAHLLLQKGEVSFVITIPENFYRDLIRKARPRILVEADATDPIATAGAIRAAEGVLDTVIRRNLTGSLSYLQEEPPAFEVEVHRLYNPEGITRYNIVPGLIAVVLMLTGVMMTAVALTRERERGTMENLLAMPVKPVEVMAGKIAPYVIISYIQSFIIITTALLLFKIPILGSFFLLSAMLIIFITCNLALGFMLSTWAKNQMQAMQLSIFTFLPSILLSGFMFPFRGMPEWAQVAGNALPTTYFIRIVRGIMLKGASFAEIWPHVWPLLIFMVVITAIAMKFYRRTLD